MVAAAETRYRHVSDVTQRCYKCNCNYGGRQIGRGPNGHVTAAFPLLLYLYDWVGYLRCCCLTRNTSSVDASMQLQVIVLDFGLSTESLARDGLCARSLFQIKD
jgi:hypothetical protein